MSATMPGRWPRLILGTTAILSGLLLLPSSSAHAQSAQLTVNATVAQACTVSAPDPLNFGTYVQAQSSHKDAQVNISFTCGSGLNVRLDINDGLSPGGIGVRNLVDGAGILGYQLYKDALRSDVWGLNGSGKTDTATGSSKTVTIYGRIPADQVPATTGAYTDTVTVSLIVL